MPLCKYNLTLFFFFPPLSGFSLVVVYFGLLGLLLSPVTPISVVTYMQASNMPTIIISRVGLSTVALLTFSAPHSFRKPEGLKSSPQGPQSRPVFCPPRQEPAKASGNQCLKKKKKVFCLVGHKTWLDYGPSRTGFADFYVTPAQIRGDHTFSACELLIRCLSHNDLNLQNTCLLVIYVFFKKNITFIGSFSPF